MNQRRSYPNSGDFNLDDLFRPEPGQQQGQPDQQQGQLPGQQQGQPGLPSQPGQPEYLGGGPGQPAPAPGGSWGGQQQYAPPQAAAPAPETQYLPPYPTADPQGGGYPAQGGPQGYPPPPQAAYGSADQGYAPADHGYQQPGYPAAAPASPGYAAQADTTFTPARSSAGAGGRRPSSKLIIGGVVAGCAAAGILVAVLVSNGDSTDNGRQNPGTPVAAGSSAAGSGSAGATAGAMSAAAKEQAKGLSDLLGTANDSRQAVIGAVASVQKCDKLPESQQALTAAAGQRRDLKTKLAALKTDQLPTGPQLVEQLNQAWEASATADTEYAAWAGDAQAGCDPKKDNAHYKAAVAASGTATTAKKQASALWNAIAGQAGLATKSDGDL
ncbi:hypothetical protein OG689_18460 [Kitasatospora sp. NBC_00240]|uniref:hypothetical protein n=1 Tax=Kitasatospora sp. NBC_00240 TaxID=2903567 RepID=UPI002251CCEB|nr:hypothetical protein [Kitasatospora sp. NBC_00240]MCX5211247.1 hypothetical protein [Kitasatospora sp. NBC_00240]